MPSVSEASTVHGRLMALAMAALLAACAGPMNAWNIAPGTSRDDVVARAGQPTRTYHLPDGGQRLQYSMQPQGYYVFDIDLDASGKVVRSRQVMNAADFQRILYGRWSRDDVMREFGPPAWEDGVASWNGPVWTYRWKEGNEPMFYWVYFDPQGVVQRAHPGMEFINAPNDKD